MEMYLELWVWLGALLLFVVIELFTVGLTTIWFAGGSLVATIMALLHAPLWSQIVAFLIVSIVLLVFTRPILVKKLKLGTAKTNIDSLIGQRAQVIVTIDNKKEVGYAVLNGQEWTARSSDDDVVIAEDEYVEVVAISGVKLIVKPSN